MDITKDIDQFLGEIDFLPIGEKINKVREKIGELRKLAKGATEKKQVNAEIIGLRKKEGLETSKFEEVKKIFNEYKARIDIEKLKSIPCPAGAKIAQIGMSGMGKTIFFIFTSQNMEEWYKKNIGVRMRPFRNDIIGNVEDTLLELHAYGFAACNENQGTQEWHIEYIQPLVFFEATSWHTKIGKGKRQPLKKPHLLMLFCILKLAKQKGIRSVYIRLPDRSSARKIGQTELEIYKEIEKIAFEKINRGWDMAVFTTD